MKNALLVEITQLTCLVQNYFLFIYFFALRAFGLVFAVCFVSSSICIV